LNFIDLHGHYAWNIDDGIASKEEAIKALKKAKQQGITEIAATPHIECGKIDEEQFQSILERIEELQRLGYEYGINVKSGCELKINEDVENTMKTKMFIPIEGTKYILCEYDLRKRTEDFIEYFDDYLYELKIQGYQPIVAHIERYFYEELDIDYIKYLIDLGCIIQVNTTSILGLGHMKHHEYAIKLLNEQLVHIIASDTHRSEGIRSPNMRDCYEYLYKQGYQEKYIQLLMCENPRRIINNHKIITPQFQKNRISQRLISLKRKIL